MASYKKQTSEFSVEGRFLDFVFEGYKIKHLRLATESGESCIKLAKELRPNIERKLRPGTWVRVAGEKKINLETGTQKLKAYSVESAASVATTVSQPQAKPVQVCQPKATVLVCTKSDCCKRGANQVCQFLEKTLEERGLEDSVTIKRTGCLKQCKAGPNMVMMPDKTRYSRFDASEIPAIIDKHFPPEQPQQTQIKEVAFCGVKK
ncbi:(2Fe-2S) ferredoxin domain-containing protein [Ancylothrix sp. C2]|uniref:(2Fe-2S) ferredoxin domain-containing protein n=1 Tax=Ancylothrix sp. D3o TaxID=2953691 RepID=UPI0021BA9944|nr:(2Fe-2S) ferredoxin domain-containing protein [Ancylothrix sp. D3o]MCT7950887.1 (2Fe-2S) ferredoxin domain-containing protein [Ancylothrix sp. D3o]